jgi:hypothetical protein
MEKLHELEFITVVKWTRSAVRSGITRSWFWSGSSSFVGLDICFVSPACFVDWLIEIHSVLHIHMIFTGSAIDMWPIHSLPCQFFHCISCIHLHACSSPAATKKKWKMMMSCYLVCRSYGVSAMTGCVNKFIHPNALWWYMIWCMKL